MFYLIYEIKMDLLADEADKLAVNATQMYSTKCNYTQTVHRSIHSVIVNQGFFLFCFFFLIRELAGSMAKVTFELTVPIPSEQLVFSSQSRSQGEPRARER